MKNIIKRNILWLCVILCMIMIFCFSSQNANTSSNTSSSFAEILAKIIHSNFGNLSESQKLAFVNECQFIVRKAAHFSVYAVLGMLSCLAMRTYEKIKPYIRTAISLGICLCYAISDEIHQSFVPGRSCEFRDVCIDFSGAVTGTLIIFLVIYTVLKIKKTNFFKKAIDK